jgi:tetratricopeptide (TPR) repeat protein
LAIIDYNKAITIEPQNTELYNYRGYYYQFVVQNNTKAIEDYNEAINYDTYFFPAYQNRSLIHLSNKNDNLAFQDLNWIINQSENPEPEVYFLRSVTNENFKKYPEALSDINTAISLDSEDGRYYFQRGGINKILGKEYCSDYRTACDKGWNCEEYNEECP